VSGLLLVVDFDGTVVRGDGPVRCYARLVAQHLSAPDAEQFLGALDRFLAHGVLAACQAADTIEAAVLREAGDAWGVVQSLAGRRYGVPAEAIALAFTRCRRQMIDPASDVGLVEPLMDALAGLRAAARIALVTNSPQDSMMPLLKRLAILHCFDEIATGAGKPDGMRRVLAQRLGPDLRERPWRLLSLGDHYRNDIEPAVEIGASAAYIDRFGHWGGRAGTRARRVEDLLPALRAWAADPRAAPVRPIAGTAEKNG
jgi:FMN phosphatase YigB (HAD superfamily)